ncbi:MAG: hypothetical protein RLZZ453_215 [Chlamydiota bacterium]|jgi:translocation and assembly module TamA
MKYLWLFLFPFCLYGSYRVEFEGVTDSKTLKEMKRASNLTSLHKREPPSINALKYRADSDIPSLIKVLQANGYYEGRVTIQFLDEMGETVVMIRVNPGPRYKLESFEIDINCKCCPIDLEKIGIRLGKPVETEPILDAELKVLEKLSECGYPLAKIASREMLVDAKTKTVSVILHINASTQVTFGPLTVTGQTEILEKFIERKIAWKQGETYNSALVEKTQDALIDTSLFSSVLITHAESPLENEQLPMRVEVVENKHKSVNIGVSYQTVFGPGLTFGWENRDIARMGRTLSFQGDVTRISQTGVATYLHPDFFKIDQNMILQAQASHEDIFAYSMRSYSLSDRVERILNRKLRGSIGIKGDRLLVTSSAQNGNYWLLAAPLYLRWSSSNSLLDPTRGGTIEYTTTPAFNSADLNNFYWIQEFTGSLYNRLDPQSRIVIAQKLTIGMTFSNGLSGIPLCNRFLGGTEEDLRGYRYKSVSPLEDGKPLGGRSAVYYSFEMRFRVLNALGLVPFFDLGNVQLREVPTADGKWYKSTGLGFRFFTFMAPFRIDLAFPLNRREEIDPHYKIIASIGQMF